MKSTTSSNAEGETLIIVLKTELMFPVSTGGRDLKTVCIMDGLDERVRGGQRIICLAMQLMYGVDRRYA
jgi:hypothetical protein